MPAANVYHFNDSWQVPYPIDEVWQVLAHPKNYPQWWRGVYLSAETLDGGKTTAVIARGWLPYRLRFTIHTLNERKPTLIEFKASGDFETDVSRWILTCASYGTAVALEWNPRVEKRVVKLLSPILKPLFKWNHAWTMKRGELQIAEYLSKRNDPAANQPY